MEYRLDRDSGWGLRCRHFSRSRCWIRKNSVQVTRPLSEWSYFSRLLGRRRMEWPVLRLRSRPSRIRTRVMGSRTPYDGPLHQGPKQACDWPPVFQRNRRNAAPKIATIGNIEPNPGTPRNPSSDSLSSGVSCSVNSSPMDPSNR